MNRCSYFCAGPWPFIVFPLLLLLAFVIFQWRSVEENVNANAYKALLASENEWAMTITKNRGRDVLIVGTASSAAGINYALEQVAGAKGVRSAEFKGNIQKKSNTPVLSDPEFVITMNSESELSVSGILDSQDAVNRTVSIIKQRFPNKKTIFQLKSDENRRAMPSLEEIVSTFGLIGTDASIKVTENAMVVKGNIENQEDLNVIAKNLRDSFNGHIENHLVIVEKEKVLMPTKTQKIEAKNLAESVFCEKQIKQLLTEQTIHFELNSATVKENSKNSIRAIADITKRCPATEFEIAGHTDASGDEEKNLILSEARASAVLTLLSDNGADITNFETIGYGSSQPVADNQSSAGRSLNRRIEFNLKN